MYGRARFSRRWRRKRYYKKRFTRKRRYARRMKRRVRFTGRARKWRSVIPTPSSHRISYFRNFVDKVYKSTRGHGGLAEYVYSKFPDAASLSWYVGGFLGHVLRAWGQRAVNHGNQLQPPPGPVYGPHMPRELRRLQPAAPGWNLAGMNMRKRRTAIKPRYIRTYVGLNGKPVNHWSHWVQLYDTYTNKLIPIA